MFKSNFFSFKFLQTLSVGLFVPLFIPNIRNWDFFRVRTAPQLLLNLDFVNLMVENIPNKNHLFPYFPKFPVIIY